MPMNDYTSDGACRGSFEQDWRRTPPGAEHTERVLRNYLSVSVGNTQHGSLGGHFKNKHRIRNRFG